MRSASRSNGTWTRKKGVRRKATRPSCRLHRPGSGACPSRGGCPRINPNSSNDLRISPPGTKCGIPRKTKNRSAAARRKSLSTFTCFSDRLLGGDGYRSRDRGSECLATWRNEMQGTIVMLMALSGLGCHHKSCDVAYVPSYYDTGACYGGCYGGGYATVVEPSCYSGCYSSGYSGCYSSGYGGCYGGCYGGGYDSCYSGCYGGGYDSCYSGRRHGGLLSGLFHCFGGWGGSWKQ